jgi:hypothetical protein
MPKTKSVIDKMKQGHTNFAIWWAREVPPFLVFLALLWLILASLETIHEPTLNKQVVIFYLSGIGLSIALASASFSYARVCEEAHKERVISGGEHFLHGTILLITAMLINWLVVEARQFFDKFILATIIKLPLKLFLALCIGSSWIPAVFAAQDISWAIRLLGNVLFPKTSD